VSRGDTDDTSDPDGGPPPTPTPVPIFEIVAHERARIFHELVVRASVEQSTVSENGEAATNDRTGR